MAKAGDKSSPEAGSDKMRINLKIAGKPYPAYITPDQEEAFRQAEHNVNDYLAKLRKRNIKELAAIFQESALPP